MAGKGKRKAENGHAVAKKAKTDTQVGTRLGFF
jgi:hypothetical protein